MSVFYFAIEVWACAYDTKYLGQMDSFFLRAYKFGYTSKQYKINEIIEEPRQKDVGQYNWEFFASTERVITHDAEWILKVMWS